MIHLSYGGQFEEADLVAHIKSTGHDYIIQGQQAVSQESHSKPRSLDYWLRQFAASPNTKQADNQVMSALVKTGLFIMGNNLLCPDSGRFCKGLRLLV